MKHKNIDHILNGAKIVDLPITFGDNLQISLDLFLDENIEFGSTYWFIILHKNKPLTENGEYFGHICTFSNNNIAFKGLKKSNRYSTIDIETSISFFIHLRSKLEETVRESDLIKEICVKNGFLPTDLPKYKNIFESYNLDLKLAIKKDNSYN